MINTFSLTDKVTVITGGASGIGKAICLLFAFKGAIVYILDVDDEASLSTVNQIAQQGGNAHYKKCSISNEEDVALAVSSIVMQHGRIDVLVNNAGVAHVGNVESTMVNDFDRLYSINVKGLYHLLHTSIPHMKERGGVILNMASVASSVGLPDRFAYSMTKGAVLGMTLSVARDYLNYNIRCNCISPARVHTPFVDGFVSKNYPGSEEKEFKRLAETQPIGRMGKPEEIACLALYLCSDEASFVTGSDYPIDGGFIRLNN